MGDFVDASPYPTDEDENGDEDDEDGDDDTECENDDREDDGHDDDTESDGDDQDRNDGNRDDDTDSASDDQEEDDEDEDDDGSNRDGDDDPELENELSDTPSKSALIYARVSSHEQTGDDEDVQDRSDADGDQDDYEGSIEGQIEELKEILEDRNIELAHEPIVDEAQTGTNFDREGIQRVFKLAQRDEVGYLLVEKIDRIGRSAAETLYFIYILQAECNVTLLTPTGERDIDKVEGLLHTTLMTLMAEIENEIRTNKATKERVRSFVEKKNWQAYTRVIPLGYSLNDGWLEVSPEQAEAAKDMFTLFTDPESDCYGNYDGTERVINNRYNHLIDSETRENIDDNKDNIMDGQQVKTLLQNPAYIGKPQIPEDWVTEYPYDNVVEDPDLQIIDEETFQEAQEIIEEKNKKHSTDEEAYSFTDFVEEFSLFSVVTASPNAKLLHDCGEPMTKDGQRKLTGEIETHMYYCEKCDEHRKWPKDHEYERMGIIHRILDDRLDFREALAPAFSEVVD